MNVLIPAQYVKGSPVIIIARLEYLYDNDSKILKNLHNSTRNLPHEIAVYQKDAIYTVHMVLLVILPIVIFINRRYPVTLCYILWGFCIIKCYSK